MTAASEISLAPGSLEGLTLLWVDDHPKNNAFESELLRKAGMEVVLVQSTGAAEELLHRRRVDVIVSDVHRYENGASKARAGYELLRAVARRWRHTPLIFYTGDVRRIDQTAAQRAFGAADNCAALVNLILTAVRQQDPQKAMWGGRAVRNFRRLDAVVSPAALGRFRVELTVREFRDAPLQPGDCDPGPLRGEVHFHLHSAFPNPVMRRKVVNGKAVLTLIAWGAFTVGAVADGGSTFLEYDLSTNPSFPESFRSG